MLDYFLIGLLAINLICVLILIVKGSTQSGVESLEASQQKINKQYQNVMQEMTALKSTIEQKHLLFIQEVQQYKMERQAFEASFQETYPPAKKENLFLVERYKEIFDLQKQGRSVEQIAKELEKGTGEITLILQLASQDQS